MQLVDTHFWVNARLEYTYKGDHATILRTEVIQKRLKRMSAQQAMVLTNY